MITWSKNLMLFRLMILIIYLRKLTTTQKLKKLKRKYPTIVNVTITDFQV